MRATRAMRLVFGMFIMFGAVASFGVGLAAAGTSAVDCESQCNAACDGECEEFTSVGCGCVWYCTDGTRGEILCG